MARIRVFVAVAAFGLSLPILEGCADPGGATPPMGKVHGKVIYNGKPLTKGTITFLPIQGKGGETGQSATGSIESDGSFVLTTFNTGDGAILGQHTAIIQVREDSPPPSVTSENGITGRMPEFTGKNAYKPPPSIIPVKYTSAETSPLRYTIVKVNPEIVIELKD